MTTADRPRHALSPVDELRRMIGGFRLSQAVHVAAALDISDLLHDGPLPIEVLAARAAADTKALRRLMRALAAAGLYHEEPLDTFANTAVGEALESSHPQRSRDWAVSIGRPYFWNTWGHLDASIRSGDNTFSLLHGMNVWEHRVDHPEDGVAFDRGMAANTLTVAGAVIDAYDFSAHATIVDVGGGTGALLSAILRAYPTCRGVLFEQPDVVEAAWQVFANDGVADRSTAVGGSFTDAIPSGGDLYILKSVLHDWEDREAVDILRVCRAAMRPGVTCMLVEQLLEGPNLGLATKISDLNMLVMPGGLERTQADYDELFRSAGFRPTSTVETTTAFHLIQAEAV